MRPNFNLILVLAIAITTTLFCSPSLFANGSVGHSSNSNINNHTDKGKKLAVATYDVAPKLNANYDAEAICDLSLSLDLTVTGLELSFDNQSAGNYSQVEWNFGDGHIMQTSSAQHTYEKAGTYYLTVSIFDEKTGCMDFIGASVYVNESATVQTFDQSDLQTGAILNLR